jgi:transposase
MAKRGPGQPTKYKPEYCERLLEHMSAGLSYESFAGEIGVSKQTIYDWEDAQKEFKEAKTIAFEKCRLWWEKAARDHLLNEEGAPSLNSTIWIFNMKNRFPAEWRDRSEMKHDGAVTSTIKVTPVDLSERISQLKGEKAKK